MDTRLAILSAAAFAGVVVGGTLVADPSFGSSLSPASIWSQAATAFGGEESDEWEEHGDDDEWEEHEDGVDDEHDDDEHEEREARDGTKHTPLSILVGDRRAPGHDDRGHNDDGEHEDGDHDDHHEDDD